LPLKQQAKTAPPLDYPPGDQNQRWHDAEDLRWAARHWAARIGVSLHSIHLRQMTTKWASISTAGRLTLSIDLLNISRDLGEFVIVHELVHLLCPDGGHGRLFRAYMGAYLPDWQDRFQRLNSISCG
jgi:predicted metal-dependent hydrolase